uniref:Chromo domain-containing protein n=1 Tax=Cannabis sativa TaxID=3483 RepID=A0A803PD19_CANSA
MYNLVECAKLLRHRRRLRMDYYSPCKFWNEFGRIWLWISLLDYRVLMGSLIFFWSLTVYGRVPPSIPAYSCGTTSIQADEEDLLSRGAILQQLKENLHQSQNHMRQQANKKRRDHEFRVGDLYYPLPELTITNKPLMVPLAILATRSKLIHAKPVEQVLVQWFVSSPEDETWEDFSVFKALYDLSHLEDKVVFEEGSNVSTTQDQGPILIDPKLMDQRIRAWAEQCKQH